MPGYVGVTSCHFMNTGLVAMHRGASTDHPQQSCRQASAPLPGTGTISGIATERSRPTEEESSPLGHVASATLETDQRSVLKHTEQLISEQMRRDGLESLNQNGPARTGSWRKGPLLRNQAGLVTQPDVSTTRPLSSLKGSHITSQDPRLLFTPSSTAC